MMPSQNSTQWAQLTRYATWGAWISYFALLITFALSKIDGATLPEQGLSFKYILSGFIVWIISCFPLLIMLPGMIRNKPRTYAWLAYITLVYFILSVLLTFTENGWIYGITSSIASTVLFVCCLLIVRWHKRISL